MRRRGRDGAKGALGCIIEGLKGEVVVSVAIYPEANIH